MLDSRNMNGVEICRPKLEHEIAVNDRIKESLFSSYKPGKYSDKKLIVPIVNLMYEDYYRILDEYLPTIDPLTLLTLLSREYEKYGQVVNIHKQKQLSSQDEDFWIGYGSFTRRGIKHLFELVCKANMDSSWTAESIEEQEDAISTVLIAVEELVELYMRSDLYRTFLDEITLTLDPNESQYFHVEEDRECRFDIRDSVLDFHKYVPEPTFLQNREAHAEVLNESFLTTLGLSYWDTIRAIESVIDKYSDISNPEKPGIFEWREAVDHIAHTFKIKPLQADRILNGFCLTPETLADRKLYKPKQEYRAYKRAFFKYGFDGAQVTIFSHRMAKECLELLIADVAFRKLPPEWHSKSIKKSLDKLSLQAGQWFEAVVEQNLELLGIKGSPSVEKLNVGGTKKLKIPQGIGEIDFLGFHKEQKLLVIIEAKQVGFATEPRMMLDDISKFITDSKNYREKFIKKYNWAMQNIDSVEKHLLHEFGLTEKLDTMGCAMITLYQTTVSTKIKDFTCISITEFMNRSLKDESWAFSKMNIRRDD